MAATTAPTAYVPTINELTMDEMVELSETSADGTLKVIAFCDGCDEFTECTIDCGMIPLCPACI